MLYLIPSKEQMFIVEQSEDKNMRTSFRRSSFNCYVHIKYEAFHIQYVLLKKITW